jgi:O-antigen/teichoic acid export membrane protein
VEPTAIVLLLEDAGEVAVVFLILAVVMAAVAIATVAVLASMLFTLNLLQYGWNSSNSS